MTRSASRWRTLLVAILAALSVGSFAEAAGPRTVVRHRAKHSARMSSQTTPKKKVVRPTHKKKKAAAKRHVVKAKHKPATKPR